MLPTLMKKIGFPEEAISYLQEQHRILLADPASYAVVTDVVSTLMQQGDKSCFDPLQSLAEKTNIPFYALVMIVLLLAAEPLHDVYRQRSISDTVFYDTLYDLTCKLHECKRMHGVWGTFVGFWYINIYRCRIFKLGRLEFEQIGYPHEDYHGFLKKGDPVLSCHIPSCGPLTPESVTDSLKQAYAFFTEEKKDGLLPVFCSSWLLYPPHRELFPEGSNLRLFHDLFDVYKYGVDETNHDFWRIFYVDYDPQTLPTVSEASTLQHNFKSFLLEGNCMGWGKGILLFDGANVTRI